MTATAEVDQLAFLSLDRRDPTSVTEALEDVHRHYCSENTHDPVCRILTDASIQPLKRPTDSKLGGQRQGGYGTAATAAELVAPKAGTQRAKVLATFAYLALEDAAPRDHVRKWTDVDLATLTKLPANSVRPRRVELVDAGWLRDSGERRKHNGRDHVCWTLTEAAIEALGRAHG